MIVTKENTVAEVVADNIKTADVFKKFNIDFCCGGGVSIQRACEKKGINPEVLLNEICGEGIERNQSHDFNKWELDFLADYIVNVHHNYVAESIPLMLQYANRVAQVHGANYPETVEINKLVMEVVGELSAHMKKEELVLFPYVKKLVEAKKTGSLTFQPHFGTVNNPIRMMEMEHEQAGDIFKRIAELSSNYTPHAEACNTFKALYAKLDEFERDLHQHIHLENNILFPKASLLEKELKAEIA